MDDKILLNISLGVAIIGIVILLLLSFYDKIPETGLDNIRCEDVGRYVKIRGVIGSIVIRNNSMSIRLEEKCVQDVFIFDTDDDLTINDTVTVQGTVQEYNGKLSIMADSITIIGR